MTREHTKLYGEVKTVVDYLDDNLQDLNISQVHQVAECLTEVWRVLERRLK